jgi:hypothetical protein
MLKSRNYMLKLHTKKLMQLHTKKTHDQSSPFLAVLGVVLAACRCVCLGRPRAPCGGRPAGMRLWVRLDRPADYLSSPALRRPVEARISAGRSVNRPEYLASGVYAGTSRIRPGRLLSSTRPSVSFLIHACRWPAGAAGRSILQPEHLPGRTENIPAGLSAGPAGHSIC